MAENFKTSIVRATSNKATPGDYHIAPQGYANQIPLYFIAL